MDVSRNNENETVNMNVGGSAADIILSSFILALAVQIKRGKITAELAQEITMGSYDIGAALITGQSVDISQTGSISFTPPEPDADLEVAAAAVTDELDDFIRDEPPHFDRGGQTEPTLN